jgi:hypothetical protein
MRTITQALLALGFAGALAVGAPVPAKAQIITFNGPGVGAESITYPDGHWHFRHGRYRYSDRYHYSDRYADGQRDWYSDDRRYSSQYHLAPNRRYTASGCLQGYIMQDEVCTPYLGR